MGSAWVRDSRAPHLCGPVSAHWFLLQGGPRQAAHQTDFQIRQNFHPRRSTCKHDQETFHHKASTWPWSDMTRWMITNILQMPALNSCTSVAPPRPWTRWACPSAHQSRLDSRLLPCWGRGDYLSKTQGAASESRSDHSGLASESAAYFISLKSVFIYIVSMVCMNSLQSVSLSS